MRRAVLGALLLTACSTDTEIVGSLRLVGERVPVAVAGRVTSIGLIDSWVLVTTTTPVDTHPPDWPDHTLDGQVQWVNPEGTLGPAIDIGWSTWSTLAPGWAHVGDRLVGSVWAAPTPGPTPPTDDQLVTIWSLSAGGDMVCHDTPHLRVWADPGSSTIAWDGFWGDSNVQTSIVDVAGQAVALASAEPSSVSTWWRLLTIRMNGCRATGDYIVDEFALNRAPTRDDEQPGNVTAVSLGGDLGVLFRPFGYSTAPGATRVRWMTLTGGSAPSDTPVSVGRYDLMMENGGAQPRGSAVGDRVAFFETARPDGTCFALRTMNRDGTAVADAPWQLPCMEQGPRRSSFVDLRPVSGAAIVTASDATPGERPHIYASALTASGRRGSEVIDVAASSAQGASLFHIASDGDDLAIVYTDSDGAWLQHLSYARN
jgi:hypothetical protein